MKRAFRVLIALIVWSVPFAALAESLPVPGALDSRIRSVPYRPDEVYRLHGFVGYQIDLQFEAGETFVGLAAGDIEGLSFVAQDNHLFLKPKVASIGTNLTILTTQRHYHVDYTATWKQPDPAVDTVVYALQFLYPPVPEPLLDTRASEITAALQAAPAVRPRNWEYAYCGHPGLRPLAAFDDGIQTRLRFAATTELPALFVRQDDGSESLLNFSVEDGEVVIHRVTHRLVLRRGAFTGCVVNRVWTDRASTATQTISPDVKRVTVGGGP